MKERIRGDMNMIEQYKRSLTINRIVTRYKSTKKNIRKMIKDLKTEGIEISEEDLIKYLPYDER
jgi:predicted enzyme involved in methoxymalonyl-ACP biosynthesis